MGKRGLLHVEERVYLTLAHGLVLLLLHGRQAAVVITRNNVFFVMLIDIGVPPVPVHRHGTFVLQHGFVPFSRL